MIAKYNKSIFLFLNTLLLLFLNLMEFLFKDIISFYTNVFELEETIPVLHYSFHWIFNLYFIIIIIIIVKCKKMRYINYGHLLLANLFFLAYFMSQVMIFFKYVANVLINIDK